jgi:hypothetical protein
LFLLIDGVAGYNDGAPLGLEVGAPDATSSSIGLVSELTQFGGMPHGDRSYGSASKGLGNWTVTFDENANAGAAPSVVSITDGHLRLNPKHVRDLLIVFRYELG